MDSQYSLFFCDTVSSTVTRHCPPCLTQGRKTTTDIGHPKRTLSVLVKASADERPRRGKTERPEHLLFERSEFRCDSEVFHRSSEAGAALIFCLLFHQGKSRYNYNGYLRRKATVRWISVYITISSSMKGTSFRKSLRNFSRTGEVLAGRRNSIPCAAFINSIARI